MNRKLKYELGEYAKITASIVVGMVFMVYLQFLWVAKNNYFCVPKAEAEYRRNYEEAMSRFAVDPIDEFEGLGEGEWAK